MALLPVNMGAPPDDATLSRALAALAPDAPVVILIHGFRYCPDNPNHCPHDHILSLRPSRACWKSVSWPRHLGLHGTGGLAIGFGWPARGTIWQAMARTGQAAAELAILMRRIKTLAPHRPLHLVGHSLGARLAMLACRDLPARSVQRLVLISAALFRAEARSLMQTPALASAEVFNVTGRENLVFDLLLRLARPHGGPTVGRGLAARNWLDLRLDNRQTLAALALFGHRIPMPRSLVCHWSGYLRPGVFGLYRALLRPDHPLPLAVLRAGLDTSARRETHLPSGSNTAS